MTPRVQEAYRVLKPGGTACLIGPVHPTHPISRFFADAWMLFPTEEEYTQWFEAAGFENVEIHRIGPSWYRGVRRHGLIMGCSVTGTKARVRSALPLSLPRARGCLLGCVVLFSATVWSWAALLPYHRERSGHSSGAVCQTAVRGYAQRCAARVLLGQHEWNQIARLKVLPRRHYLIRNTQQQHAQRARQSCRRATRLYLQRKDIITNHQITLDCVQAGNSPLQLPAKAEERGAPRSNPVLFLLRLLLGTTAGLYFFLVPIYMWLKDKVWPRSLGGF